MRVIGLCFLLAACASAPRPDPAPSEPARHGDEIVVAGERFRTGTPVVLWSDPGGYNAYVGEPRYGARRALKGDRLADLRDVVTQVIVHYDVCGTSCRCFDVLQSRGLSCHFLLDVDGTIYQTLDCKERAWHAGNANGRSIGIEIAQIGAYRDDRVLSRWYGPDGRLTIPSNIPRGRLPADLDARAARPRPIHGRIHGGMLMQYDYTRAQYRSLAKLLAALCRALPEIRCETARTASGDVMQTVVPNVAAFRGILGHYHLTKNKIDPGPAFDWDLVLALAGNHLEQR